MKSIVIVGGGHAGVEAALAISRIGCKAIIVTMDKNALARMSCNPAIGGLGKGHLAKEIDALGGAMGLAADLSGIQFKQLNKSKGRAVWSPRAQIDKLKYPNIIKKTILSNPNISIIEGEVVNISVDKYSVSGAIMRNGNTIKCNALIITSGTFMGGKIHIGDQQFFAGRFGERPSDGLTQALINIGFKSTRLKTGTPPRLLKNSINWSLLRPDLGDKKPSPFSILSKSPFCPLNEPCYIVNTNINVHDLLRENISRSAIYSGNISALGPRYCPSIEDKIVRFSSRNQHQLFLEPEWLGSDQIYLNGFSTSMPESVQLQSLRKIPALKRVKFIRPGYAIEYDYFPTHQLTSTLESKNISGLYFAGQINGTSGYEEAAAQGLIAGANAALSSLEKDPLIISRTEAYIGVMIDDLITKDIDEPYRMFTSRAEHRLSLRPDNAALRLTPKAFNFGLISKKQMDIFRFYKQNYDSCLNIINSNATLPFRKKTTLLEYLKKPESSINDSHIKNLFAKIVSKDALFSAETQVKYQGYVQIENARVKRIQASENKKIPKQFNYDLVKNLSNESREKLSLICPETLGQASRIAGVRPSDLAVLSIALKNL